MGRKKKEQPLIKIDCEYCADRRYYGGCSKDGCPWLENQIPMGRVTYREAVTKHFFRYKELRPRVNQVVKKYEGPWTNIGHIPRMQTARKMTRCFTEKDTSRYHAVMYLLTSSFDLFARILGCFSEEGLHLNRAELRNISPHNRALFNAACKIYNGNDQVLLTDLTGRDPIDDAAFQLILTALMVSQYGPAVLSLAP